MKSSLRPLHWILFFLALFGGVAWRFQHTLVYSPPSRNLVADMKVISDQAHRLMEPNLIFGPDFSFFPPGLLYFLSALYSSDPSGELSVLVQFTLSLLIPFAVGGLALQCFGKKVAVWSFLIASFYFPFLDYASFYLPEIYVMLFVPIFFACFLRAAESKPVSNALLFGVFAGVFLALLEIFRSYFIVSGFCLLLSFLCLYRRLPLSRRFLLSAAVAVPAYFGLLFSANHCRMVTGQVCIGSHTVGANFLMGHLGRGGLFQWNDAKTGYIAQFKNPSAVQRGRSDDQVLNFAVNDDPANIDHTLPELGLSPLNFVCRSFEHVVDSFLSSYPWPNIGGPDFLYGMWFHYFFLVFLLFPSIFLLRDKGRGAPLRQLFNSQEGLMLSFILGFVLVCLLGTGEARFRIPLDTLFIILAAAFFFQEKPQSDFSSSKNSS